MNQYQTNNIGSTNIYKIFQTRFQFVMGFQL